jgi:hypothetical protein
LGLGFGTRSPAPARTATSSVCFVLGPLLARARGPTRPRSLRIHQPIGPPPVPCTVVARGLRRGARDEIRPAAAASVFIRRGTYVSPPGTPRVIRLRGQAQRTTGRGSHRTRTISIHTQGSRARRHDTTGGMGVACHCHCHSHACMHACCREPVTHANLATKMCPLLCMRAMRDLPASRTQYAFAFLY